MMYQLVGGNWGTLVRRPLEAASRTFIVLMILFFPIAFGVRELYPWASPESLVDAHVLHQSIYLNLDFFFFRAAFYFLSWIVTPISWQSGIARKKLDLS